MSGPLGCAIHLRTGKINPPLEYIPLALAGKNEVGGVRWRVEKERFGGRGTAKMVASTLAFGTHIELGPGHPSPTRLTLACEHISALRISTNLHLDRAR